MKKEFWLVRVGTDERPASSDDIKSVRQEYEQLFESSSSLKENVDLIVTHHAVRMDVFQKDDENYNENMKISHILLLFDKGLISKKAACKKLGIAQNEQV